MLCFHRAPYPPIKSFPDEQTMLATVKARLAAAQAARGDGLMPRCHVMGALGRCGSGAVACLRMAGIPECAATLLTTRC